MHKKTIFFSWSSQQIIEKLKFSLSNNLINITSTDTIPGLLANTTKESFEKLNKIKQDRVDKPYLILISSVEKIEKFVDVDSIDDEIKNLIEKCWPGPVTIIFKTKKDLPNFLKSKKNTIALRCPKNKYLLKLLESFDGLFSTSANISGKQTPRNLTEIEKEVMDHIDLIVIDKKKQKKEYLPSTIIDATQKGKIKVVRIGQYNIEKLEKYYGKKID